MKPFLQQVANLFYQEKGANIEHTLFVFPSRRACVFFQQHLLESAKETFFAPSCYTISDFFQLLTPEYESEDRLGLLFRLYTCYTQITDSKESFDSFMSFGEILLKDFSDIDNYLVNAEHLFTNIDNLKELENTDYLSEQQLAALEKYLGFISNSTKKHQLTTGKNWKILYQLYNQFTKELLKKQLTYDGLQHRIACQLTPIPLPDNCDEVVFVGFNALDGATRLLFEKLQQEGKADFYWDYQSEYINDPINKAHYFMEENLRRFPSKRKLLLDPLPTPTIHVVSTPSSVGQTKYVAQLLQNNQYEHMSTAVVLANEQLLIPMLYAMPNDAAVNITMGYPLKQTAVVKLIDDYLLLQSTYTQEGFYHTHVKAVLNHPYMKKMFQKDINNLPAMIHQLLRIAPTMLHTTNDFTQLFTPADTTQWIKQVRLLLEKLTAINELDKELVEEAIVTLVRLQGLLETYVYHNDQIKIKPTTLMKIIRRLLANVSISFIGEPIHGIQMMGMLETRCLDFNQLIITSFNEGIYPKKDSINTYIPYSIRNSFGLPTTEHQDAVYAYNFYRLIQRASDVYLLYDTRNDSSGTTGEVSRFAKQLEYAYQHPNFKKTSINCSTTPPVIQPVDIKDKEQIRDKVVNFLSRGLSASSLNHFIECPLKFYFSNIEQISFQEDISEEVQANQFGTIYHYIMEHLYEPYTGKTVNAKDVEKIKQDTARINELTEHAYAHTMYGLNDKTDDLSYSLKGIQLLTSEIIKEYVIASLQQDIYRTPFTYIGSEKYLSYTLQIPDIEATINIKGYVDRIEKRDNYLQVYDYKTSKSTSVTVLTQAEDILKLFSSTEKVDGKDKLLQLCFYHLLAQKEYNTDNIKVHLYFVKNVFMNTDEFNKTTERPLPDGWKEVFLEQLNQCIVNMLDADKLLTPAEEGSNACKNCNFKAICGR